MFWHNKPKAINEFRVCSSCGITSKTYPNGFKDTLQLNPINKVTKLVASMIPG